MTFIKIAAAALVLGAGGVWASPEVPKSGSDYLFLADPQPTSSGKKVEVTEFFSYSCRYSNAFDPALAAWVKAQGDKIVFKRVPVAFRFEDMQLQKLYYTLEVLGKNEELHSRIFNAIHVDHRMLVKPEVLVDFVVKMGIDKQKFLDVNNSFSVQAKQRRATQTAELYNVDASPLVAIDGRYATSLSMVAASMANKPERELIVGTLKVMSFLVDKSVKR